MSPILDAIFYWVGAAVVTAIAGAAVLAILVAIWGLIAIGVGWYSRRIFNGVINWHAVAQWDAAGRPVWTWDAAERAYVMRPSKDNPQVTE